MPDSSRRILVLTLSFGSGHIAAANAVAKELLRFAPDANVEVVDALAHCRLLFRAIYVWPYWAVIRYAPALWRRIFTARHRRLARRTAPAWAFRLGCPQVFATIDRFQPDVMVACEIAAGEMAAIARRRGLTDAQIVNVITDRSAEPGWVQPEVDLYTVSDDHVLEQLGRWGVSTEKVLVSGVPIDRHFAGDGGVWQTVTDEHPRVLLMGGGMGPTRMDRVVERLCTSAEPMHVIAVAGRDARLWRRLANIHATAPTTLTVHGWSDDVPSLMRTASILVTKPGGLTTSEAAACGVPMVLFDAIPGPEEHNAAAIVAAGAGVHTCDYRATVNETLSLVRDSARCRVMAEGSRALARPSAVACIARATLGLLDGGAPRAAQRAAGSTSAGAREDLRPAVILTIRNGAGHTRAAEAISAILRQRDRNASVQIVDVADYMTPWVRFTHVTAYLWLVTRTPALWDRIDRYQKRQSHTSPAWYYRRGCWRLFELVRRLRPAAIVATEVGCCEIAALIKRDLALDCPLVAVNGEYDADRAWVQPEVDLYSTASREVLEELCGHGAARERVYDWGVPLTPDFHVHRDRHLVRAEECRRLGFTDDRPIVLIAGGREGLGRVDEIARRLLQLPGLQLAVLAGRNRTLQSRCERLASGSRGGDLRVLGWTSRMPELMAAADLMVSKPGRAFDEAIASGLPLVSLPPPPGSEHAQYRLLEEWQVGRAVRTLDEMSATVEYLFAAPRELEALRRAASGRRTGFAAERIAEWILDRTSTNLVTEEAVCAH